MKVKCGECGHQSEIAGDVKTTWKCSCTSIRPGECQCEHVNEEELPDGISG